VVRPQDRWTIAQIAGRLQGRTPPPRVHTLARPPQPAVARPSRPPAMGRNFGITITAAVLLLLAAIVVGPRLLRRHSEAPPAPAAALELPPVPSSPRQEKQAQPERPSKKSKSRDIAEEKHSEAPTPVPASIHPETPREEPTETVAKLPAGAIARGEVAQRILPNVPESARNTIRGTVKVTVNVDVDRSGNVEGAELESPGPSKYFARAALQAAQDWRFKPPNIAGQGVLSSWTLRFEFKRDGTTVIPKQESP